MNPERPNKYTSTFSNADVWVEHGYNVVQLGTSSDKKRRQLSSMFMAFDI